MEKERLLAGLEKWRAVSQSESFYSLDQTLKRVEEDLKDNLIILIIGEFKAGKSTFINALLGEKVLTVDVTPTTAIITKLTYGEQKRVLGHFQDGSVREYSLSSMEQLTVEWNASGENMRSQLSHVEFQLPLKFLKSYTLVDSPGLIALHEHHTAITENYMERSDIAIWLFNAMSVGTASQLDWLQRIENFGTPLFGVVNGIDMLDEEEDLDEFFQFNERRLSPQITKLYGVSAKEILTGKIENNLELIDWGNGSAIDEMFKDIGPVKMKKMESFYRKLMVPLKEYNRLLKKKRDSLYFQNRDFWMNFLLNDYPQFLENKKLVEETLSKWTRQVKEWEDFIRNNSITPNDVNRILKKLNYPDHLTSRWGEEIEQEIRSYNQESKRLKHERTKILELKKQTDNHWEQINQSFLKASKIYSFLSQEEKLKKKIEDWDVEISIFNIHGRNLQRKIGLFNAGVVLSIREEIFQFQKQFNLAVADLEQSIKNFSEIKEWQQQLNNYKIFCNEIVPLLRTEELLIMQTDVYRESVAILTEIEGLYTELNYEFLMERFSEVSSYKLPQPRLKMPVFKSIKSPMFKKTTFHAIAFNSKMHT